MSEPRAGVRIQDLRTLFRAREIVTRLAEEGLEPAIETVRTTLVTEKSRRQYLQEMLPSPVSFAVPGTSEMFTIESADGRQFHLQNGTLPLLWQILDLERACGSHAVQVIHHNKHEQLIYWL
jgi:hypothetical protein